MSLMKESKEKTFFSRRKTRTHKNKIPFFISFLVNSTRFAHVVLVFVRHGQTETCHDISPDTHLKVESVSQDLSEGNVLTDTG